MTRKKKMAVGVAFLTFLGLLAWESERITFAIECLAAESALHEHFTRNETAFQALVPMVKANRPIDFYIYSNDTMYITFEDTTNNVDGFQFDNFHNIEAFSAHTFQVDSNGFLTIAGADTVKTCEPGWTVSFYGDYRETQMDAFLPYLGWTRSDFNQVIQQVQALSCYGFEGCKDEFVLSYERVLFYPAPEGLTVCFGRTGGYFDYLYTNKTDNDYSPKDLIQYSNNYYGITNWHY